ncbi:MULTISPECIES: TIGR02757 family protein [Prevotella]|uniref:TIGR02757 family protein n=1 Tax=Prevotella TaxID=838 RepID=UPI001F006125|nr:TIGR02757 family protein [Prevotella brunnea]
MKRISGKVRQQLIANAATYECREFIANDPSCFMHQVSGERNQETMAFIASCLSYGSRAVFMPKISFLLEAACGEPHDWVRTGAFLNDIPDDFECFYRLYTNHTMVDFFQALREMFLKYGSLRSYVEGYGRRKYASHTATCEKMQGIDAVESLCSFFSARQIKGMVPQNTRSSCKRLCMFLRWMVRQPSAVDLGIWGDFIDKKTLIIPLDTHVFQQGARLGLIEGKSINMTAARQLTNKLARVFPDDPLKGDFALFGADVNG